MANFAKYRSKKTENISVLTTLVTHIFHYIIPVWSERHNNSTQGVWKRLISPFSLFADGSSRYGDSLGNYTVVAVPRRHHWLCFFDPGDIISFTTRVAVLCIIFSRFYNRHLLASIVMETIWSEAYQYGIFNALAIYAICKHWRLLSRSDFLNLGSGDYRVAHRFPRPEVFCCFVCI